MLSESGDPVAEDLSELLEQFPNFFVMTAVEPSITEGRSITVFRFPSGGALLKASARWFAQGAEKSGFELVSEGTTTVGTGAYPAVRFDWVGGPPPPGPSVDYVIDDGPQVWTVGFVMPEGDDVRMAPTIDDVIDSITLPDGRFEKRGEHDPRFTPAVGLAGIVGMPQSKAPGQQVGRHRH
jgi:hypothetical protein